jgi:hypothetical protein
MSLSSSTNARIVLASRPVGVPTPENFRLEHVARPSPKSGEVLLRTLYLSLDPYMRGRMSDGPSYAEPVAVGGLMVGATVCVVEESQHAGFAVGERVLAYTGWQTYAVSDGTGLTRLSLADSELPRALGVLGMPGFTAFVGLMDIGEPKAGETVVVAAATGAVGSVVGQLAKLQGCRVIGIAGGASKCAYAVKELGFDACIDHRDPDLRRLLAAACPKGIDVYFENVGGAVLDAVIPLLNVGARVPVCGLIAYYNMTSAGTGPDLRPALLRAILVKRLKVQGFIIFDHYERRHGAFQTQMAALLKDGRIRYREDVVDGLDAAPKAFIGLLAGDNFGKLVIRVSGP